MSRGLSARTAGSRRWYPERLTPPARAAALAVVLALTACAGARSARSAAQPVVAVPDLEVRSLLLLLADREVYEPFTVQQALKGGPALREELAVALGRARDPAGRSTLEGLLLDEAPAVRRAAAFGLGALGDKGAVPALLRRVADSDRETGVLAVEALGKLGAPVTEVGDHLLAVPEDERWARLLPHLFRFKEEARVPLAEQGLALKDPELHARAAYALAREPLPEAVPILRNLLVDPYPQVRAWAARGLGIAGDGKDLARLEPLMSEAAAMGAAGIEEGPCVEALRAAQALLAAKKGEPPVGWRTRLATLAADPRPGVRVTALELAGYFPLENSSLGTSLAARASEAGAAPPRERGAALVSLARAGHPQARALAAAAAKAKEPDVRSHAAEAAKLLGAAEILDSLAGDSAPLVRETVLAARLEDEKGATPAAGASGAAGANAAGTVTGAGGFARAALGDADEGVRATALDWLATHPVLPLEDLGPALARTLRDESVEPGQAAVKAVAARAEKQPLERGALIELLERTAAGARPALRREAVAALAKLGRPAPAAAGPIAQKTVEEYRQVVQRTRRPRRVELRTSKGAIEIRLDCPRAPLTCLSFLDLAAQGFYDGLSFHRVVPDFVVQGGDPRGDGYGGPGYTLRDEIGRLRYARGVLGMALAGPDTGGSQFFLTLSPQPHLDGGFTAFGEVTRGLDVLDQIEAGDRIERVRELP
ncbi:MAG TPA: peptidylprolyl isomerase [Thermoanaerobaculia bacterium]